jgi:polyisoprenoid-binding protein YceI
MFRRTLAAAGVALLLAACASLAHVVYPVNTAAAEAKPGQYQLDPQHAVVIFSVDHLGFSTFYGRFDRIAGVLDLDPKDMTRSSVNITVDADSVDTRVAELDQELKAEAMLNAAKFPRIGFVSTGIVRTGENTGKVTGDLTIAGVTRPVTLDVTFHGSGTHPASGETVAGFNATAPLKRSDFGLKQWLPIVGDDVSLLIEAEFHLKKG